MVEERPDALRNGEHPLAHGKRRQDVIDEMGGGLDNAAGITRRTCSPAPTGEKTVNDHIDLSEFYITGVAASN